MVGTNMVGNQIDTFDALMAHYVAGSLPEPARILVAAHLEMQPVNRLIAHDLEALAGEALELMPAADVVDRNARLAAIFASSGSSEPAPNPVERSEDGGLPRALRDFIGYDLAHIPWRSKLPGFRKFGLGEIDGCTVNMIWIRPGRKLPTHTHQGAELTLVLEGAFSDARGRYGPGEISIADDSIVHRPVAEKERPCIAFSVLEAPIKFKGPLTRLVGDLLG